uniref:Anaphase-promoting complex subunit 4 WD40 domain-containing protein n=1 Tax=Pyramimonas obovata TaxID=1411642 RepID=A0A7S0N1I4_9CHLO|mmetsp:Transcript_17992/g.39286  ORF Transcript_17992/g.39286 Transcript_17992/m.39286 type:complete len:308 (+) Transcript_17992:297-1220(+)
MQGPVEEPVERLPNKEVAVLRGHEGPVFVVKYNRTGQYCLTGGKDRTIRLWIPNRQLCIKTYTGHGQEVRDVACTQDNNRLASCGGDKQVFYWDVSTGRTIRRMHGHDHAVNAVVFAAHDTLIVTAGYDQAVKVWDCRSNSMEAVQAMKCFQDSVTSVQVAGHAIVAGSVDGTVRTFDVRRGRVVTDDLHHPVTSVRLSNDGNCLLAGCLDARLRLLDRGSGEELAAYAGHANASAKLDCAFTGTDGCVLGGSETGEVLFWDLVDANVVARMQAHTKAVVGLDYHPTDVGLATCSVDGTAKLWAAAD